MIGSTQRDAPPPLAPIPLDQIDAVVTVVESKLAETHGYSSPILRRLSAGMSVFSTDQSAGAGIGAKCAPPLPGPQDLLASSYKRAGAAPARGRTCTVSGLQIKKPAGICSSLRAQMRRRLAPATAGKEGGCSEKTMPIVRQPAFLATS